MEQVTLLREKYHVYLQDSGRISIAYVSREFWIEPKLTVYIFAVDLMTSILSTQPAVLAPSSKRLHLTKNQGESVMGLPRDCDLLIHPLIKENSVNAYVSLISAECHTSSLGSNLVLLFLNVTSLFRRVCYTQN